MRHPILRSAPAGSAAPGAIAAISRDSDFMDVFWIGIEGAVFSGVVERQLGDTVELAPPGSALGGISAVSRSTDFMDVFWTTSVGAIHSFWWNGGWGPVFETAPASSASPEAVATASRNSDQMDVFWITPGWGVGSTWWHGGERVLLRTRELAAPTSFTVAQAVAAIQQVFAVIDIDIEVASSQSLSLPALNNPQVGKCEMGSPTSESGRSSRTGTSLATKTSSSTS